MKISNYEEILISNPYQEKRDAWEWDRIKNYFSHDNTQGYSHKELNTHNEQFYKYYLDNRDDLTWLLSQGYDEDYIVRELSVKYFNNYMC